MSRELDTKVAKALGLDSACRCQDHEYIHGGVTPWYVCSECRWAQEVWEKWPKSHERNYAPYSTDMNAAMTDLIGVPDGLLELFHCMKGVRWLARIPHESKYYDGYADTPAEAICEAFLLKTAKEAN